MWGCSEPGPSPEEASLTHLQQWFSNAAEGARGDHLCHGLGMLKHAEFSCSELLDYAAKVDRTTRTIVEIVPQDCFGGVCGTFYEVRFTATDPAGNEVEETALLKVDEGRYQTYWYRSTLMLAELGPAEESELDQKDPEQIAYDALTAAYPALYQYPPCFGVRPSSSNLRGELESTDALDVQAIENRATECGETFCFAFVGQKVATLCPPR